MPRVERPLLAERLCLDAAPVDAVTHQVLLGRGRAAVAQGQVVLVGAALVTMPRDADVRIGIRLKDPDLLVERPGVVRADVPLVEVEVNHRGEHRADRFGAAAERRQRIGGALPGDPLGLFTGPRRGLRRRDGVLPCLLCGRDRIRIGLRRGRRRLRIAPAGNHARGDEAGQHKQQWACHVRRSPGQGVDCSVSGSRGDRARPHIQHEHLQRPGHVAMKCYRLPIGRPVGRVG